MAIRHTEVDGVPTIVVPATGPTVAGLTFRVGRADETLARSGITHLLEHLALFPLGLTDYHYNGATGPTVTTFHTTGSADDVATFLATVCDSLAALPMHRVETEKSVIRTEWANRSPSVYEPLRLWRYGARTDGLLGYDEPGIYRLTANDLEEWSRTWFTSDNAVLWVAGEVPPGLRLRLPAGARMPLPRPTSALPTTPAYFVQGSKYVAMEAIVERSPAAAVFTKVLERSLFRDLRRDGGLSYSASAEFEPRGDGYATVSACVDAQPEHVDAVLGGFIDTLAKLRVGRIEPDDMTFHVAKLEDVAGNSEAEAARLPSCAFDLLTGQPVRDLNDVVAELRAVTADAVHEVAKAAGGTALLMVPNGLRADWAGFTPAPVESTTRVDGKRYPSLRSDRLGLHVAAAGVMSTCDDVPATVLYKDLAAMLSWPDGARRLIGNDGTSIHVEPTLWRLPAGALGQVDVAVDPNLVVPMPARSPEAIPTPSPQQPAPAHPAQRRGWSTGELTGLILSFVVAAVILCLTGLLVAAAASEDPLSDDAIGWGPAVVTLGCSGVFVAPAIALLVRHRRRIAGR